jgi:diguanylate cyclase (GGDEF)-like protein
MTGVDAGHILPIEGSSIVLGRGSDADLRLDDPSVSRRHVRIAREPEGHYSVVDLDSTNGTFVGARRISHARLASGDHVQLGPSFLLRFALIDPAEEELQAQLYESSIHDTLTKAYNRRYLLGRLAAEVSHARRHSRPLAVLMADVDRFKEHNDRHGHFVGDRILCFVAAGMMRLVRAEDVVARYGGDEFVVLARESDRFEAQALAERLRRAVAGLRLAAAGGSIPVTISVGVAALDEVAPSDDESALVELADRRLYAAKLAGRNKVSIDAPG